VKAAKNTVWPPARATTTLLARGLARLLGRAPSAGSPVGRGWQASRLFTHSQPIEKGMKRRFAGHDRVHSSSSAGLGPGPQAYTEVVPAT
jgi:hypothetical protein